MEIQKQIGAKDYNLYKITLSSDFELFFLPVP